MFMALDLTSLLLGLGAAAVPLLALAWQLQRKVAQREADSALLDERLSNAQLAQDGLNAQLDACRDEISDLSQANAVKQADLAALRREVDLLRQQHDAARQAQEDWSQERGLKESELRRLDAQCAGLNAELREQQESHQQRLNDLQGSRDELRAQFAELAGKIFDEREQRFAETSQQQLGQLLNPLKERIQSFEKRVEESYQQEARERFSLGKELERLQQLNQRLSDEATNLTRALKGQKTQGNWGELILERVLEHAGLEKGREYQTQVSLKGPDGERFQPDVLIMLPGDKQVIVDAKVAFSGYLEAMEARDDATRDKRLDAHARHMRDHIDQLGSKAYWEAVPGTPEFVVMFVPAEPFLNAALERDPTLFERAFARNVILATPATLVALLRTVGYTWRQEQLAGEAMQVLEVGRELHKRLGTMGSHLTTLGKRLNSTVEAYNAFNASLDRNVVTQARRFSSLQGLDPSLDRTPPLEVLAVPAQKPDLHAVSVTQIREHPGIADADEAPSAIA